MTKKQLEEFGHRLIRFRVRYNISQVDFAKMANLSQPTVSHVEQGTFSPTYTTMAKIEATIEAIKRQAEIDHAEHDRRMNEIRNL